MPKLNRDGDEAKFLSLYLGKGSKREYQPIIDHIKNKYGLARFIREQLQTYAHLHCIIYKIPEQEE